MGNALDGRTGRRAAPSALLPPGRGEVGRGVDPGGWAARTGIFPIPLISELPGSAGVPPARTLVRASRDAGGTPAHPEAGPPSRPPPFQGGGEKAAAARAPPGDSDVSEPSPCAGNETSWSCSGKVPFCRSGRVSPSSGTLWFQGRCKCWEFCFATPCFARHRPLEWRACSLPIFATAAHSAPEHVVGFRLLAMAAWIAP